MVVRHLLTMAMAMCLAAGCASTTPPVETRSYALQNRSVEEALIKDKLDDEAARLGAERQAKMYAIEPGGRVEALSISDDGKAIVRTSPHAHREIAAALVRARKDAAHRGT